MRNSVGATLVALLVSACALLGAEHVNTAFACSRAGLDRDSTQVYLDAADAVAVGTFGDAHGEIINLHVEWGLKGVRTGDTLKVVNQDIDDCPVPQIYSADHPFAEGMHVLLLLKHEGLQTGADWRVSPSPGGWAFYDGGEHFAVPTPTDPPLPSLSTLKQQIKATDTAIDRAFEQAPPCNGGFPLLDDPLALNKLSYVVAVGTFGTGTAQSIDFIPEDVWRGKVAAGAHLRVDNRIYGPASTSCDRPVEAGGRFTAGERALLFLRPDRADPSAWEIAGWHTEAYWVAGDHLSLAPMPTLDQLRKQAAHSSVPPPVSNDDQRPLRVAQSVALAAVIAAAALYAASRGTAR